MKGLPTLAALLLCAAGGGALIYCLRSKNSPAPAPSPRPAAAAFVENAVGLRFASPPRTARVPAGALFDRIDAHLDRRFGPHGLDHRTRALELLGLLPPDRHLRDALLTAHTAGARGWFDPFDGTILLLDDFDPDHPPDRAVLHRLLTRNLLHQHAPPLAPALPDDAWRARLGLHRAIAAAVEDRLREAEPESFAVPDPAQTEREAVLLGLPVYVHNLAQFHHFQVPDFLETRLAANPEALPDLVRNPPATTLELLGGDPGVAAAPQLPPRPEILLEESLGALGVRILLEWLADYDQAAALAPAWRGDLYRLSSNPHGRHLLWICRWTGPETARAAAAILNSRHAPAGGDRRHRTLAVRGTLTVFANCADPETLAALLAEAPHPDSPPPPAP